MYNTCSGIRCHSGDAGSPAKGTSLIAA
ncbi:CxxxxCH/CxxCH domain-containing protein [Nocardia halotolerans]|uniref:CxxxxCH/CxxCH domain-containing protein n=1 Tax=Nocardia halotolerans TaxID=1755878 RepID=A0ABV8VMM4_9NOCA